MIRIASIKFRAAGKLYDFDAKELELQTGDRVVVETDRGRALGTVVIPPRQVPRSQVAEEPKSVLRLASPQDLESAGRHAAREDESFRFCLQRIQERKMEMKLVRAEYLFDGSKIIFYFTADGRVDFRELVKDLAHHFHTRIEMRQIGVRDEAKLTGGLGICGRELCCCTFLREFEPVSVKMAKEQGLALNPNKISGQCGRLLCCLSYEFETYCEMKKCLPKCGRKIRVGESQGEVVNQDVLGQTVTVQIERDRTVVLSADQLAREGTERVPPPARPEPAPKGPAKEGPPAPEAPSARGPKPAPPAPGPGGDQTAEKTAAGDQASRPPSKKRRRRRRKPRRQE